MSNVWMRVVLGLSIAGGSLAMAGSASATVWRNFENENYCLSTGNNGSMSPGTGLILWQCNTDLGKPVADQAWGQVTAPFNSDYVELFDMRAPTPVNSSARCAGIPFGSSQLILWTCNTANQAHDQGWHPFFQPSDSKGHTCYSFGNEEVAEDPTYFPRKVDVFGVANRFIANGQAITIEEYGQNGLNGTSTRPDQIWCAY